MTYRPFESSSDVTLRNMFHPRTRKIQSYISNLEILTLNTSGILGIQVQYISLDGTVVNKNDNFSNTPHSNTKHPFTQKIMVDVTGLRNSDLAHTKHLQVVEREGHHYWMHVYQKVERIIRPSQRRSCSKDCI